MDNKQNKEVTDGDQNESSQESSSEQDPPNESTSLAQIDQATNNKESQATENTVNQNSTVSSLMEVHHPHHPSHKKKWSEYLLEFFMLFLAVFLGFVAENIRETYVERHREKEYIIGMVQNLKDDTTQLYHVIRRLTVSTEKMDSLVHLSKADFTVPENLKALTRIELAYAAWFNSFKTNNATLTQLKQSGNLRLIRTDHVADSLLSYDYLNSRTETQFQECYLIYNDYVASSEEVFDFPTLIDTTYMKNFKPLNKLPPP
ncbi:hypothetical protein [Pontibacter chitinilyticus]|uniref:hypothetical protein n=1 Tax=Pontibacter chitinilyticus TaxID=2674989 RepID=UPI00321A1F61